MTPTEIKSILLQEIAEIAPEADLAQLGEEVDFREELDIDSIGFLNLVIAMGQRLQVEVPEGEYAKLTTIGSAIRYFADHLSGSTSGGV